VAAGPELCLTNARAGADTSGLWRVMVSAALDIVAARFGCPVESAIVQIRGPYCFVASKERETQGY
jgi:hypothetical protein